jgi:hypothetical protein
MHFGSRGKDKESSVLPDLSGITDITDEEELQEIQKIVDRLDKDEKVMFVAKQSRYRPGGSKVAPDTLFVTPKRLIVRDPSMMGMRENFWLINYDKISSIDLERGMFSSTLKIMASGYSGDIDAIKKEKAESILSYIREKMYEASNAVHNQAQATVSSNPQLSLTDELAKLVKFKEQGVLSEAEFTQMKQELLKRF